MQFLCYGVERHIILKAGEVDLDCISANTLITFFLFTSSSVSTDALNHLQAAKSKLGMATDVVGGRRWGDFVILKGFELLLSTIFVKHVGGIE